MPLPASHIVHWLPAIIHWPPPQHHSGLGPEPVSVNQAGCWPWSWANPQSPWSPNPANITYVTLGSWSIEVAAMACMLIKQIIVNGHSASHGHAWEHPKGDQHCLSQCTIKRINAFLLKGQVDGNPHPMGSHIFWVSFLTELCKILTLYLQRENYWGIRV